MIYDKQLETMSRENMQELQLKRLKEVVQYAYDAIPFYKKKYDEAGFSPDSIKTLDDIRKIPFVVKADLRENYPYGLSAVHTDKLIRIHASSGTSGKPTVVVYTKKDLDMWSDCCARLIVAGGGSSKDIVQVSFGYGLFTGALGMHQGYEKLGATIIPASSGNTERQIMLLKDLKATALVSTPSYALYIGEMIEKLGYNKQDFNLKLGFFGSEASSVEMHKEIQKRLGVFPTDNYGLSEIIGPGVSGECMEKDGMHINEDHFYPEVLDSQTLEPVKEGEYGELVLTTLTKEGMPVIRYCTKDITSLNYQPCKCGRTTVRMARLRGRTDDMLIIKGVNVFPSQIESVLMDMPEIGGQYEIIVTRDEHYMDTLEVKVEVADGSLLTDFKNLEILRDKVKYNLRTILQIDAKVKLVEPLSLKRYEGKSKRVIDLRKI
ncbi:MAG: phenylacetate--CoA ligase family protein [Bacillota bacterium]